MSKISVIIPCYNQGQYIDETLESVYNQSFQDFEIIIVNDGSTDNFTNKKLKEIKHNKVRLLETSNQGLSQARNNGIKISTGKYILPLDSDDKIGEKYLEQANEILDKRKDVKIVFGNAEYFGDRTDKLELWYFRDDIIEYDVNYFLTSNFIYCSSFFRKIDYDKTCGFNPNMKYGWEDWDFWLSLLENGGIAYKLLDTSFYYRYRTDSMVRSISDEQKEYLYNQLYQNHKYLYNEIFVSPITLYIENIELKRQLNLIRNSKTNKLINFVKRIKSK